MSKESANGSNPSDNGADSVANGDDSQFERFEKLASEILKVPKPAPDKPGRTAAKRAPTAATRP